jgi:hypothetical protein
VCWFGSRRPHAGQKRVMAGFVASWRRRQPALGGHRYCTHVRGPTHTGRHAESTGPTHSGHPHCRSFGRPYNETGSESAHNVLVEPSLGASAAQQPQQVWVVGAVVAQPSGVEQLTPEMDFVTLKIMSMYFCRRTASLNELIPVIPSSVTQLVQ